MIAKAVGIAGAYRRWHCTEIIVKPAISLYWSWFCVVNKFNVANFQS